MPSCSPPLIYHLFPPLIGNISSWVEHARRAKAMGFNTLCLSPCFQVGYSQSVYAIKDPYRVDARFLVEDGDGMSELQEMIAACHELGLTVMIEWIINYTAKDAILTKHHPEWFRRDAEGHFISPSTIDPADERTSMLWPDLAEVDNAHAPQRQELWAYWTSLMQYYLDLGFDGFCCNAAYRAPAELWRLLIRAGKRRRSESIFIADVLGCRFAEVHRLADVGFDFLLNSSCWWNFDDPWCLEQHSAFQPIAPSISFPEHTQGLRLMARSDRNLAVQKQRYAFSAAFSTGISLPIGYEFAFRGALDAVHTTPQQWEQTTYDLQPFIRRINQLKQDYAIFSVEGSWSPCSSYDASTLVLRKAAPSQTHEVLWLILNKDWHGSQEVSTNFLQTDTGYPREWIFPCRNDSSTEHELNSSSFRLSPAEVVYVIERS